MEHSLSYVTDEQRRMTEIEALKGVTDLVCVALVPREQSSGQFVWLLILPAFVARRSCSHRYTPFSRLVCQNDQLIQTIHYFVPEALARGFNPGKRGTD